jgi:hypothetical protein
MKYLCFEKIGDYLNAFQLESKTKTKQFEIKNKSGSGLGYVKWYAPWRKYCFFTSDDLSGLVFDVGCLTDICNFINKLMAERKEANNG